MPMSLLDTLAERRIREAQDNGEFDSLPGSGMPLTLEDESLVPEELRAAYRMLKNAGFVPPEIAHCRELRDIETLLLQPQTDDDRRSLLARLNWLLTRNGSGRQPRNLHIEDDYFVRIADRFGQGKKRSDA